MATKKKRVKAKRSGSRQKRAVSKALRRAPKKPAKKRLHRRVAVSSKESAEASAPTVAVYEVVEAEVYQEPALKIDDEEEGFGT